MGPDAGSVNFFVRGGDGLAEAAVDGADPLLEVSDGVKVQLAWMRMLSHTMDLRVWQAPKQTGLYLREHSGIVRVIGAQVTDVRTAMAAYPGSTRRWLRAITGGGSLPGRRPR